MRPSRNRPFGEGDVGQEVADVGRCVGERGDEVGAGEQPGDRDVAAEEAVGDGQELDRDAGERRELLPQRLEHLRAVLPGQDDNRCRGPRKRTGVSSEPAEPAREEAPRRGAR